MNKQITLSLKVTAIGLMLSMMGCTTLVIPVNSATGNLNLNYRPGTASHTTGKAIAIVSPEFAGTDAPAASQPTPSLMTVFGTMVNMPVAQSRFQPQIAYQNTYRPRLKDSMVSGIQEIISNKGFGIKGPYATFDDMSYGDKKDTYLAAVPTLKIYFDAKPQQVACVGQAAICTDQGTFTVTGELVYRMIEPLTGQAIMTKRVNLSDFNITRSYFRQYQWRTNMGDFLSYLFAKLSAPASLSDNTDAVMTDAINEFYRKAMTKIDTMVSTGEILSYEGDVRQLKELKRF